MRYRILLMGANTSAINDFFKVSSESFDLMSTSLHYEDIHNHFKYFSPDAIVCCLNSETQESVSRIVVAKNEAIKDSDIPFIIIGSQDDCTVFSKTAVNLASLQLVKPITMNNIKYSIKEFLDQRRRELEKAEQEKIMMGEDEEEKEEEKPLVNANPKLKYGRKRADLVGGEFLHVLVVDDDVRMLKSVKRLLEDEYQVASATSGELALRFLESKPCDLILLDYEMPGMSGPEVLENIKKNAITAQIPVVFLTGASEREKIAKALSLKPQGYLLKPVDREQLIKKTKEIFG